MIFELEKDKINDVNKLYKKYFNIDLTETDPFKKVFYYIIDNEIVAFIDYSLIYERIELNYLLVIEKYRRKNIASMLIDKLLEEKVNDISLEVNVNNNSAIQLYKKYGFEIAAKRENYYQNEDAYLMIRK